MKTLLSRAARLSALAFAAGFSLAVSSASAREATPPTTPFLPVANEPPATLKVFAPLPQPLADRGVAIIPYGLENFRILPIFGQAAAAVSPRAGHLHVTVDDLPWHWADAGANDAVVVTSLPPGRHKVLIELATPEHRVLTGQSVEFVVPATKTGHAGH